jgi:transcriptional regulator with XRE-family HTH domain
LTEKELHGILGSNIKLYRKNVKMTQVALAQKAGVSINFINDLEAKKKWPSFSTLVKLAEVFRVDVYELLMPPDVFPGSLVGIVKKYTDTIHAALEQTQLEFIQDSLMHQAAVKKEGKKG